MKTNLSRLLTVLISLALCGAHAGAAPIIDATTDDGVAPGARKLVGDTIADTIGIANGAAAPAPRQIAFVDSRVPDLQKLIAGVKPGVQVVLLAPARDGVQQIADVLAAENLHGLSAIQVVSHGGPGELQLGSTLLTDRSLASYSDALAQIKASLLPGADIVLYGCNVGSGAAGVQFIADLSNYTGADVAAATHVVGSAKSGGSWTLDAATGSIEASEPFSAEALASFRGVLTVYSNATNITVNNNAVASPYPSNIVVSGATGTITSVKVILRNVTKDRASDIDVLLVGPGGQKFVVISDAGGNTSVITNVTATFDSASATVFGDSGSAAGWGAANSSSTSRPANYSGLTDTFAAPAPAGPYQHPVDGDSGASGTATFDSVFDGADPNGTWSLYVVDDSVSGAAGNIAGGWSLDITTAVVAATSTTLTSSVNPTFTAAPNAQTTLTATVTSSGSPVTTGTVDFKDGTTVFQAGVALNGSGQAVLSNHVFTAEGARQITAVYNGTASFATSTSNTVSQEVNNHTTVSGSNYSNDISALTIVVNNGSNGGTASPYPSKIFVPSGLGTITDLNVALKNVTFSSASDLDLLLVGPGGQKFVLVSDAGGNGVAISNVSVTFDDSSATALFGDSAATTGWGTANSTITARPVNRTDTTDTWPSPAPSAPYQFPQGDGGGTATLASVFNGADPSGTWSLYVIDDGQNGGVNGSIAGGWTLNFTFAVAAGTTTTVGSNNNPSFTAAPNNSVTFTASVTSGATVNEGTVTFKDNGIALPGSSTVNVVSGQAQFTTTFAAEGSHPITAVYNGTANFGTSTGSVAHQATLENEVEDWDNARSGRPI